MVGDFISQTFRPFYFVLIGAYLDGFISEVTSRLFLILKGADIVVYIHEVFSHLFIDSEREGEGVPSFYYISGHSCRLFLTIKKRPRERKSQGPNG